MDTEAGVVSVDRSRLRGALHGDEVVVEVQAGQRSMRGSVARILGRPPLRLTGVLDPERGFLPDDARFPRPLRCALPESARGRRSLYGATLLSRRDAHGSEVKLLYELGERGVAADERDAMLWRERVEEGFPRAALEEARAASRRPHVPCARYEDLRELAFVTIDPPDAEDHDDALFAQALPGDRTRCCVAIADVAALVAEGGALDLEAKERGATLYIPGCLIPMLPRCISADAASLLPGEDRRAVVLDLVLDPSGRIQKRQLRLGIIRSRERLSYEEAADLLYHPAGAHPEIRPLASMIQRLDQVATCLRERRAARGAVQMETPSVRVDVDAHGEPVRMRRISSDHFRKRACGLVEELMLLANQSVAELLETAGMNTFCRAHAAPSPADLARVLKTAARHDVQLAPTLVDDARALQKYVDGMAASVARSALRSALLDVMPTASYAGGKQDHFALATGHYVHFTSPIRRYPDVLVHRAVHALVLDGPKTPSPIDMEALNAAQQRARRIHQEINGLYGALLASDFLGTPLRGTVVRVGHRDLSVLADDPALTIRCSLSREVAHGERVIVVVEQVDLARRAVHGRLRKA